MTIQGKIINIQRYCIHDGPGIRTVVFLKGCPLACLWCSNPESQSFKDEISVNRGICVKCMSCVNNCEEGAISENDGIYIDREKCILCGKCIEVCPTGALKIYGRCVGVDAVMAEVVKDRKFYKRSGGGMTLSGGEPVMQKAFSAALLDAARVNGIHTVLETAGYAKWEDFKHVAERADMIFYDIKHMDPEKHLRYTGCDNAAILFNLRHTGDLGKPVVVRIPVIPGVNDDDEAIAAIGRFAKQLDNVMRMGILPYHSYGKGKYAQLDRPYLLNDVNLPDEERMIHIKALLEGMGHTVEIGM